MKVGFIVRGEAKPAGSKRAFAIRRGGTLTGRVAVVDDCAKSRGWKTTVAGEAGRAMQGSPMLSGPLALTLKFHIARPAGHWGTGKNAATVKPSAPSHPVTRPDTTKLVRAIEDAMLGIVYRDDAQIVSQVCEKVYSHGGAFVAVTVEEICPRV